MNNLQESMLDAMQVFIKDSTAKLNFPLTLECEIIKCTDEDKGEYEVNYLDNHFLAYCQYKGYKYNEGEVAYVLIPKGDFSKTKIILGIEKDGLIDSSVPIGDFVEDVKVDGVSVVTDSVANINNMATKDDISTLQRNFQAGVDAIGDACERKGSIPASSSLEDTVAAIDAIQTGGNYMTKEIIQDGTYNASDDNVDAYDHVIVAVRGGLRPHTVTFLDKDEETILEVVNDVPWGGGAIYHGVTPTSSGMRFIGWSPNPTYVTEDLWCRPRFENMTYSSDQILDDWVTIARHCEQDMDYYPTGKWKLLELQDGGLIRMQLVAKGVDAVEGANGYANTTWVAMDTYERNLNPSSYGNGYFWGCDWSVNGMRDYLNTTFLNNNFPQELAPYVKTAIKYTTGYRFSDGVALIDNPTLDKIWIPSRKEILNDTETLGVFYDVAFGENGEPSANARRRPYYGGGYNSLYSLRTGAGYGYYTYRKSCYTIYNSNGNTSTAGPSDGTADFQFVIGFCL